MAEVHVLPGKQIQVESWFDSDGHSPQGADVQVFGVNGSLLVQGMLDAQGIFAFTFTEPVQRLKIVVSAGQGHAKELTVTERDLEQPSVLQAPDVSTHGMKQLTPLSERRSESAWVMMLVGVSFLLAASAFWLSLRNSQRIRRLEVRNHLTDPPEKPHPAALPTDRDRR